MDNKLFINLLTVCIYIGSFIPVYMVTIFVCVFVAEMYGIDTSEGTPAMHNIDIFCIILSLLSCVLVAVKGRKRLISMTNKNLETE